MRLLRFLSTLLVLSASWSLSAQQTIHVPADQSTIQGAIDAAQNGDTVFVSPGTYTENIDFKGKAITVTSGASAYAGAQSATIQPAHAGPVVVFQTAETSSSVLNGFTIISGYATDYSTPAGDGIRATSASPTLTNNDIKLNTGCGIFATNPTGLSIRGNWIHDNLPQSFSGRNPHCGDTSAGMPDNVSGVGIYMTGGTYAEITGNKLQNDTNGEIAAGPMSQLLIQNNWIEGAVGVFTSRTTPPSDLFVIQNIFAVATPFNGSIDIGIFGITDFEANPSEFGGITAVNNTVFNGQGGVASSPALAKFTNNVFSMNSALFVSGEYPPDFHLLSCASYGLYEFSKVNASNNDLFDDGLPSLRTDCPLATANLDSDPQFLSIDPTNYNFKTARTSPVVAAGDINAPMLPATDFAGKNRTVCGTIDMGAYEVHPQPPISIVGSPNPSVGGSSVTFAVHVTGNCNIPTGTVTLLIDGVVLGAAALDAAGSSSFSMSSLTVGTHSITVTYPGDFNFDETTSAPYSQVVTGYPTATTLSVAPNPAVAFTPITFQSTVTSNFGNPTGSVRFVANGQTLASAVLGAGGVASSTVSTLGAGTYGVEAIYSADVHFAASVSPSVTEIVTGANTSMSLTASPNPASLLQTVTFLATVRATQGGSTPTGMVTFSEGANVFDSVLLGASGTASLNLSTLPAGSHTITATYGGSGNFDESSASVIEVINLLPSTVTLTGVPNPAGVGQTVMLTATVTSPSSQVASGNVNFYDAGVLIGTGMVGGNGSATLPISTLSLGTHNLTAAYSGNGSYRPSTSAVYQEEIVTSSFTIALRPSTLSIKAGAEGSSVVNLTSVGLFAGPLALSYGTLPIYATGSMNPTHVTLSAGATQQATLQLSTFARTASVLRPTGSTALAGIAVGGGSLLLLLGARRKRNQLLRVMCAVVFLYATVALTGCTNSYYTANVVAPGTYVIPVTATDSQGNSQSAALTVVITQ